MGQNPVPPVNIPIPTKIGSKMGGEFTYQPKWDPKTVLTTTAACYLPSNQEPPSGATWEATLKQISRNFPQKHQPHQGTQKPFTGRGDVPNRLRKIGTVRVKPPDFRPTRRTTFRPPGSPWAWRSAAGAAGASVGFGGVGGRWSWADLVAERGGGFPLGVMLGGDGREGFRDFEIWV